MWKLFGLGDNEVKILDICRPTLLHCAIKGGKSVNPATGKHLHGKYVIDVGKVRPATTNLGGDARDGSMKIEFDLSGATHLNLPGALYLTDGNPAMEYEICTSICECYAFMPTWHALVARTLTGTYLVPEYHSRIRTAGPPVTFTAGGLTGVLDHMPIPVTGDDIWFFGTTDVTIITEWWG